MTDLATRTVQEQAAVQRQKVALEASDVNRIEERWGPPRSLLPPNETILDNCQEMADAARYPFPVGSIIRCKDPYACDERLLPFLAWERSVDLWKAHWPLAKKRYVTDQALAMQRAKGTDFGIRWYVDVAGGKVLRIDAPPSLAFPGRNQTPEERVAWLAQFPQLRIYPFSAYGYSQTAFFTTKLKVVAFTGSSGYPVYLQPDNYAAWSTRTPVGPVQSVEAFYPPPAQQCLPKIDMTRYLGNKTFLFDKGVETPVDFFTTQVQGADGVFTSYNQIVLPGSAADVWFAGQFPRDAANPRKILKVNGKIGYFTVSLNLVATRTITSLHNQPPIDSDPLVFSSTTVSPGLTPVSIVPENVYRNAPTRLTEWYTNHVPLREPNLYSPAPQSRAFTVNGRWGFFGTDDRARYNIYSVLYLYNPKSPLDAPRKLPPNARLFSGHSYYQYPAFQAKVTVEVFGTLPKCDRQFYNGRDMFLTKIDMSPMYDCLTAIRAAKSARDAVWMDTRTYSIATPNVSLRCGQIRCGEVVPLLNV